MSRIGRFSAFLVESFDFGMFMAEFSVVGVLSFFQEWVFCVHMWISWFRVWGSFLTGEFPAIFFFKRGLLERAGAWRLKYFSGGENALKRVSGGHNAPES